MSVDTGLRVLYAIEHPTLAWLYRGYTVVADAAVSERALLH